MSEIPCKDRLADNASIQKDWKASVVKKMTPLSGSFYPGPFDVICSRGKKAKCCSGNLHFQSIIQQSSKKYARAKGGLEKSLIVSEIIDIIRRKSPDGGFVKLNGGRWFEVGDWIAKERVGQSLRDLLHGQYRSSASSKKRRRERANAKKNDGLDLDVLIDLNMYASKRIKKKSDSIEIEGSGLTDMHLMDMMTKVNSEILNDLKQDKTVQKQLGERSTTPDDDEKNQSNNVK